MNSLPSHPSDSSDSEGNPIFTPITNLQEFIMNNHLCVLQNSVTPKTPEEFVKEQQEMQKLYAERAKKAATLQAMLGMNPEEAKVRPKLSEVNPQDIYEIIWYAARQNLACAFDCCADEDTAQDVERLAHILKNVIPNEKHVHIGLYEEKNWDAIVLQNPQYASQYFTVSLKDEPQHEAEQQEVQKEFLRVYHQYIKNHD